jgi:hexaprenyl-diphosphate synthase
MRLRPLRLPRSCSAPSRSTPARRALSTSTNITASRTRPDPFKVVAPELAQIRTSLVDLLSSSNAGLDEIAKYYFLKPSKQLRPLLVLLFSQATNGLGKEWEHRLWRSQQEGAGGRPEELDMPLTRADVLNDFNPSKAKTSAQFSHDFLLSLPSSTSPPLEFQPSLLPPSLMSPSLVLPTQMRLAQIVEMMHAASLLHDDVIDESPLRRGSPSAPSAYGSKLTILAGNFILGRASTALARLGDPEVVELIASVLANLVEGEILQMQAKHPELPGKEPWSLYLQKTYMKTASLMAKGARGAVILGGCLEGDIYREVAYAYGRNLGIAFQVCKKRSFIY